MDRRNDRESARRMAEGARLDADAARRLADSMDDALAKANLLNAANSLLAAASYLDRAAGR